MCYVLPSLEHIRIHDVRLLQWSTAVVRPQVVSIVSSRLLTLLVARLLVMHPLIHLHPSYSRYGPTNQQLSKLVVALGLTPLWSPVQSPLPTPVLHSFSRRWSLFSPQLSSRVCLAQSAQPHLHLPVLNTHLRAPVNVTHPHLPRLTRS